LKSARNIGLIDANGGSDASRGAILASAQFEQQGSRPAGYAAAGQFAVQKALSYAE
jgi:hypothetical protein